MLRLLELGPKLRGGALGGAVSEVEDYTTMSAFISPVVRFFDRLPSAHHIYDGQM